LPRVWIDVLTPKQVLFFTPLVEELNAMGCEVLATSRRYREIGPIAKAQGLDLVFVGERGGSTKADQLEAATRRQALMIPRIARFSPHISLSVASGVCARIAFGFGFKHVAVNDSPHSEVAGRLSLPLTHHLFCPWIIPYSAWSKFGVPRSEITRYHALDPAAWLKRKARRGSVPRLNRKRKTVVVRLEENYAPYMTGSKKNWNDLILRSLIDSSWDVNLVALCRYEDQLQRVRERFGEDLIVPVTAVDGRSLLEETDAFVGMGGTMTTESALMGVPTISAFQGSLLSEAYLTSVGLLRKVREPVRVAGLVKEFLDGDRKKATSKKARRILNAMEDPIPKIARYLAANAKQA
jgi:predicted glycosyltransferase